MNDFIKGLNLTPKKIAIIVILLLMLLFIGQNFDATTIEFMFFNIEIPLIVVIIVAFALGFVSSLLLSKRKDEE